MKQFLITLFFILISFVCFAQTKGNVYLSNVKDGKIKLSQIADTSVWILVKPETFKPKCSIEIFFHGTGFSETIVAKISNTGIQFSSLTNSVEIKKRLGVGSKITIAEGYCSDNLRKGSLFGVTYTIVAD